MFKLNLHLVKKIIRTLQFEADTLAGVQKHCCIRNKSRTAFQKDSDRILLRQRNKQATPIEI